MGVSLFVLFNAPPLLRGLPQFFREKGSATPSLVDSDVEFSQLTKLFSLLPLSTAS